MYSGSTRVRSELRESAPCRQVVRRHAGFPRSKVRIDSPFRRNDATTRNWLVAVELPHQGLCAEVPMTLLLRQLSSSSATPSTPLRAPESAVAKDMPHVTHLRSFSLFGLSDIKLIFDDEELNCLGSRTALERLSQ